MIMKQTGMMKVVVVMTEIFPGPSKKPKVVSCIGTILYR